MHTCHTPDPSSTPCGSRRRRLWDMPHHCHCPVVGVCLPLDGLRRLVGKAMGGHALADDYEIHVGAVAECVRRNRLSELLQDELDRRYARELLAFRPAKSAAAVAELWTQAVASGDVAGAFWAALSHPRCDTALQELLCRDLHMLQHQAGASVRVDISRFNALLLENGVLTRELAKVQERSTRLLGDKARELEQAHLQLIALRAECQGKDAQLSAVAQEMARLKAAVPELDAQQRMLQKLEQSTARQADLEQHNTELRQRLAAADKERETQAARPTPQAAQQPSLPAHSAPIRLHLGEKTVLCVGGRSGSLASYRDVVERVGGRFMHHDGGLEDSANALDASLAAADLVVCQAGCISHNAYWRVKDFCKRTGKRCVFVENPSASSLARGLAQMAT